MLISRSAQRFRRALSSSASPALASLAAGLQTSPLPPPFTWTRDASVPHAPKRTPNLTPEQTRLALRNALRYFPASTHAELAPEFARELDTYGHIYMYRFKPSAEEMAGWAAGAAHDGSDDAGAAPSPMRAYPIDAYAGTHDQTRAVQMMIMNNLDPRVAQFPDELITYGGNGAVFGNWAQFRLTMHYLATMTNEQTLTMYSGHPMGIFPSHTDAPRVVVTNGTMIPRHSTKENLETLYACGNTIYGQMTAGSYCYIGPQGIVHGTAITLLNAARKYLPPAATNAGRVYLTSGLGGMSGAQPKAADIVGMISITAEIDGAALHKRHAQGWVQLVIDDLDELVEVVRTARAEKRASLSIAFHGNVVDVWERFARHAEETGECLVDLGSDQTSLHNPYNGGYYPVGLTYEEALTSMASTPDAFKEAVEESLRRHVAAVNAVVARGAIFWDYGNAFLLESERASAAIKVTGDAELRALPDGHSGFKYESYVEAIMGDIFSLGFGPFRWVCASGNAADLAATDAIAAETIERLRVEEDCDELTRAQYDDNLLWVKSAGENKMVVGSQARILYADARGRCEIAVAMNDAVADGRLSAAVVTSRDHHDVSGTDSPYRETSNVRDGSMTTADMATHNAIGDAMRGATWVALHNGGGVGWGESTNGGFGLVLDGTPEAERRARSMLDWDVNNGVARRAWGRNSNAQRAIARAAKNNTMLSVTTAHHADDDLITSLVDDRER